MRACVCVTLLLAIQAGDARGEERQDPWTAADDELGRSGAAAALDVVKGRLGPDIDRLRAYLESGPPDQPELRSAFGKARDLARARRLDEVASLLAPLELKEGTPLEARICGLLAHAQRVLRNTAEALQTLRRWRAIAERLGWLSAQEEALYWEGRLLISDLRYEELAEVNARRAEVARLCGDEKKMRTALFDRAAALVELGRLREAIEILSTSLEAVGSRDWKDLEAAARDNLAIALYKQGEYASALHETERAEGLRSALPKEQVDPEAHANNVMLKAVIHLDLGDFDAAEAAFEGVREQIAAGGERFDPFFHAGVKANLAIVAWRRGQHDRALGLLAESRDEFKKIGDQRNCATACKDAGNVLIDAGRPDAALALLDEALEGFGTDPLARAETLAAQADAHLRAGNLDRAAAVVDEALAIEGGERDRCTRNRLHEIRASILLARGKASEAVASLRKAMDLVEDVVSGLSEEQTFTARERRARLFEVALECAFRTGDPGTILEFLERSRASVLRDAIGNRRALHRAAVPPDLASRLDAAEQEAVEARLRFLRAVKGTGRKEADEARSALDKAEESLRQIANRAEREHKRLAGSLQTRPVTLGALQGRLEPTEALVYYALHGEKANAFWLTAKRTRTVDLGDASRIHALCAEVTAALAKDGSEVPVEKLKETLVTPLALPESATCVMVCPDGPLSHLPWPELLGRLYGSTAPSGTTLDVLRGQSPAGGRGILAFGAPAYSGEAESTRGPRLNPLPHARDEVEQIAAGDGDRAFVGKRATEASVRTSLVGARRWRAVHFACHGIVDHRFPRRSALALTPADQDDGLLTIPEIMALDVGADLVVLSACDSGTGTFVPGEGVVGLARAFMAAGAPTVVASLWKVDDEASKELMVRFYRERKAGAAPAEALRRAQDEIKADKRWKHPCYWAAWVVWGLPD